MLQNLPSQKPVQECGPIGDRMRILVAKKRFRISLFAFKLDKAGMEQTIFLI